VGNLPAITGVSRQAIIGRVTARTLGKTGTQETGDLLDQGVGSNEGIVLACELLNQLLVLVELLQIVRRHGINTAVLGTIDIVLVTENAFELSAPTPHIASCVKHTRWTCWVGERRAGGLFRRNACHVGDHSS
jgi:hypothetical protein